jgi:hypothetical protein
MLPAGTGQPPGLSKAPAEIVTLDYNLAFQSAAASGAHVPGRTTHSAHLANRRLLTRILNERAVLVDLVAELSLAACDSTSG